MTYASWSVVFGEQPSAAKWNILGTNDAHFYSFLGDNLAWQTWTPTWTNLTVGNGTVAARYMQIGKYVRAHVSFIMGSTSSISGVVQINFPVTPRATYGTDIRCFVGSGVILDSGVATYPITLEGAASTSSVALRVPNSAGTYALFADVNGSTPITFGTSDGWVLDMDFEAA